MVIDLGSNCPARESFFFQVRISQVTWYAANYPGTDAEDLSFWGIGRLAG